jgi:hypothetical protein
MADKRGIVRERPETWPLVYDIEEQLATPAVLRCFTDSLCQAIEQLLGAGRWCGELRWGFWPVLFAAEPGAGEDIPSHGWHVAGNWFTHTLDCPRQGLLVVRLFTDVAPSYHGTILGERSHRCTARVLAVHPDGLTHHDLLDLVLADSLGGFHTISGEAGDVILAHPFMFHTRSRKRLGPSRVISNTEAPLRAPMQPYCPTSPVEHAIARALAEHDAVPADARRCWF